MRSLSPEDLLELAEDRAAEEEKTITRHLDRAQATISSIRDVSKKFPDRDPYIELSAEANFKVKILKLLDDLPSISTPETSSIEKYVVQLNYLQLEVTRTAARLIPRFDRSRRLEVAELELHMRDLAKITAQLQNAPMRAMRQAEEADQIINKIRSQAAELHQLQGARDSTMSEAKGLREEEVKIREQANALGQSELAERIEGLDAEVKNLRQRIVELFTPIAKPGEKLRKLLEDGRSSTSDIDPLLKCIEDPMNLLKYEQAELDRAVHTLRGYIERGELPMKQSRIKRALEAISELQSQAPNIRERLITFLGKRDDVLSSKEAHELSTKLKEVENRLDQIERQLSALATNQANLAIQIERSSLKLQNLKKDAETLVESMLSEPVELRL
jgi:chromosome segregation ATPase